MECVRKMSARYFGTKIRGQYGKAYRQLQCCVYDKLKDYETTSYFRCESSTKTCIYYRMYHHTQVIGEVELLINEKQGFVCLSNIHNVYGQYIGVGRACYQIAMEQAFMYDLPLVLNACYGSATYHYQMGASSLDGEIMEKLEECIEKGKRYLPMVQMSVRDRRMKMKWLDEIGNGKVSIQGYEYRHILEREQMRWRSDYE